MGKNSILNNAKYSSNNTDEWYTPYETIAEEISHYEKHFKGKSVLCNCDDPFESNFCIYFLKNFNRLGLKKLVCTSFADSKIDLIKNNSQLSATSKKIHGTQKHGYVLSVSSVPGGNEVDNNILKQLLNIKGAVKKLKGTGDFRSEECLTFLKECDICCTNPPFSLFTDLFSLIMQFNKSFLLIGNQNAITYKEIFPYIKENKAWIGYRFGDMAFRVPSDSIPHKTRFWIDSEGQKWRSIGNAMWLTNLDNPRRHKELSLTQFYSPGKYSKFDNYDAINVSRVKDIPSDYIGLMGVPITFLKYYNEDQFEIVGEANHGSDNEFDYFRPTIGGKQVFKRILIKNKHPL